MHRFVSRCIHSTSRYDRSSSSALSPALLCRTLHRMTRITHTMHRAGRGGTNPRNRSETHGTQTTVPRHRRLRDPTPEPIGDGYKIV